MIVPSVWGSLVRAKIFELERVADELFDLRCHSREMKYVTPALRNATRTVELKRISLYDEIIREMETRIALILAGGKS